MTGLEGMEATIWTDGERTPLIGRVLDRMGSAVRAIGVGGPRSSVVDRFGRDMDCPLLDDLRKMIIDHPAAFVVLASSVDATPDDAALALDQGATIIALEPIAANFDELKALDSPGRADRVRTGTGRSTGCIEPAAAFLRGHGWSRAAQPTDVLGQRRLIRFTSTGPRRERSLFARLHEAWQVLLRLGPAPESVDASLVGQVPEVPQDIRAMSGHLVAHARNPDGTAASILVSDATGCRDRSLHLVGDEASVRAGDFDYDLHDAAGRLLDSYQCDGRGGDFADLVADDWSRLIDRGQGVPDEGTLPDQVLASCLACQLSARTRQPESPGTLIQMQGRG